MDKALVDHLYNITLIANDAGQSRLVHLFSKSLQQQRQLLSLSSKRATPSSAIQPTSSQQRVSLKPNQQQLNQLKLHCKSCGILLLSKVSTIKLSKRNSTIYVKCRICKATTKTTSKIPQLKQSIPKKLSTPSNNQSSFLSLKQQKRSEKRSRESLEVLNTSRNSNINSSTNVKAAKESQEAAYLSAKKQKVGDHDQIIPLPSNSTPNQSSEVVSSTTMQALTTPIHKNRTENTLRSAISTSTKSGDGLSKPKSFSFLSTPLNTMTKKNNKNQSTGKKGSQPQTPSLMGFLASLKKPI